MLIFDEALFRQAIDFPTCSNNTLDVAFYRNCFLLAEKDQSFTRTYDCTDHDAIHLSIEFPVTEPKPVLPSFRSFGNADYNGMNKILKDNLFQIFVIQTSTQCVNFTNMSTKWLSYMYLEEPDIAKASLHGSLHSRQIS